MSRVIQATAVEAKMKTWLTSASFGLALVAAIFLLVWPVYSGFDGVRITHATLLHVNGSWVIVPVCFPVVIALLPLVFRRQAIRIVAAILLCGFSFITGFTIGRFYLPAAVTMLLAAFYRD